VVVVVADQNGVRAGGRNGAVEAASDDVAADVFPAGLMTSMSAVRPSPSASSSATSQAEALNRRQDSVPLLITARVAAAYDNEAQPMGC
jgi:hypothetical protein